MVIELPHAGLTAHGLPQALALTLFQHQHATVAKAAEVAGKTRLDVQPLLAEHDIPAHYNLANLAQDRPVTLFCKEQRRDLSNH